MTPANPTPAALAALALSPYGILTENHPEIAALIGAVCDAEYECGEFTTEEDEPYEAFSKRASDATNALAERILALLAAARQGEETDEDRDVLFEERTRLREVAFCFASAIRSGESWTPTLKAMLDRATAPWQEIARDLAARAASQPQEVSRA